MPFGVALSCCTLWLVVLASPGIVYWPVLSVTAHAESTAKSRAEPRTARPASAKPAGSAATLPRLVAELREAILAAVASGEIEELRTALDWNELKPEVADHAIADPIAYWRQASADGSGREILDVLGLILSQPHAVLPVGRDAENNKLYVWPRFAEVAEAQLTASEKEAKSRLIPTAVLEEMARTGRYLSWRLAIGADGTWHSFVKAK